MSNKDFNRISNSSSRLSKLNQGTSISSNRNSSLPGSSSRRSNILNQDSSLLTTTIPKNINIIPINNENQEYFQNQEVIQSQDLLLNRIINKEEEEEEEYLVEPMDVSEDMTPYGLNPVYKAKDLSRITTRYLAGFLEFDAMNPNIGEIDNVAGDVYTLKGYNSKVIVSGNEYNRMQFKSKNSNNFIEILELNGQWYFLNLNTNEYVPISYLTYIRFKNYQTLNLQTGQYEYPSYEDIEEEEY